MSRKTEIITMDRSDPRFYPLVGPFLARREVAKELGGTPYDDDGKQWFVATQGDEVIGFVAAVVDGAMVRYCSAYVVPKMRRLGVYRALCAAREALYSDRDVYVIAKKAVVPVLRAAGFKKAGDRGAYVRLERSRKSRENA